MCKNNDPPRSFEGCSASSGADTQTPRPCDQGFSCRRLPLPREVKDSDDENKTVFEYCHIRGAPGSKTPVTIIRDQFIEESRCHSGSGQSSPDATSRRYTYCREVIEPYLDLKPGDSFVVDECLIKEALEVAAKDFPNNPACYKREEKITLEESPKCTDGVMDSSHSNQSCDKNKENKKKKNCRPCKKKCGAHKKKSESTTSLAPCTPPPVETSKEPVTAKPCKYESSNGVYPLLSQQPGTPKSGLDVKEPFLVENDNSSGGKRYTFVRDSSQDSMHSSQTSDKLEDSGEDYSYFGSIRSAITGLFTSIPGSHINASSSSTQNMPRSPSVTSTISKETDDDEIMENKHSDNDSTISNQSLTGKLKATFNNVLNMFIIDNSEKPDKSSKPPVNNNSDVRGTRNATARESSQEGDNEILQEEPSDNDLKLFEKSVSEQTIIRNANISPDETSESSVDRNAITEIFISGPVLFANSSSSNTKNVTEKPLDPDQRSDNQESVPKKQSSFLYSILSKFRRNPSKEASDDKILKEEYSDKSLKPFVKSESEQTIKDPKGGLNKFRESFTNLVNRVKGSAIISKTSVDIYTSNAKTNVDKSSKSIINDDGGQLKNNIEDAKINSRKSTGNEEPPLQNNRTYFRDTRNAITRIFTSTSENELKKPLDKLSSSSKESITDKRSSTFNSFMGKFTKEYSKEVADDEILEEEPSENDFRTNKPSLIQKFKKTLDNAIKPVKKSTSQETTLDDTIKSGLNKLSESFTNLVTTAKDSASNLKTSIQSITTQSKENFGKYSTTYNEMSGQVKKNVVEATEKLKDMSERTAEKLTKASEVVAQNVLKCSDVICDGVKTCSETLTGNAKLCQDTAKELYSSLKEGKEKVNVSIKDHTSKVEQFASNRFNESSEYDVPKVKPREVSCSSSYTGVSELIRDRMFTGIMSTFESMLNKGRLTDIADLSLTSSGIVETEEAPNSSLYESDDEDVEDEQSVQDDIGVIGNKVN